MFGVTYKVIMQSHGLKMKQEKQKTSILTKGQRNSPYLTKKKSGKVEIPTQP